MKPENRRNVIETQAAKFVEANEFRSIEPYERDGYQRRLQSALYSYRDEADKLIFLYKVNTGTSDVLSKHQEKCKEPGCAEVPYYNQLEFFIEQEIVGINPTTEFFDTSEKIEFDSRIDEVLTKLHELQIGQQVIFDEIEELKSMPNIKKKTMAEVVKGKIVDMAVKKALDPEILAWIYEKLVGEGIPKLLNP
jgi:hypothetical protein